MLEEQCYIFDASITTCKSELFNNLVVLEARMFKFIPSFAAKNIDKTEGLSGADRSKSIIFHKKGYSERQLSEKLKFSKTAIHQAVARFKTFGSIQDLSRAGRSKATSPKDDHMMKKMVVRSPTTLSKNN